uniref:Ribonuclease P protein subunit p30 n=1 Tax=Gorilla gorilla gorilla TaxID=9595 RepID=A0A2I2YV59_GORGO
LSRQCLNKYWNLGHGQEAPWRLGEGGGRGSVGTILSRQREVGYSVVAINHIVDFKEKKQEIEKPVAVSELFTTLPIVQGKSRPIKILTRLTIIVSDPSHCNVLRATSSRARLYDVVAVFPKTEKLFHIACTHLDVDLVCITVTEKLPFYFKRPPINVAIDRGLAFELVYSPAIKDSTMRRYTISNALNLMQICKGKVWFYDFRMFFASGSLLLVVHWNCQTDSFSLKQNVLIA